MHPFRDALALCVAAQAVWRVAEPLQVRVINLNLAEVEPSLLELFEAHRCWQLRGLSPLAPQLRIRLLACDAPVSQPSALDPWDSADLAWPRSLG